MVAAELRRATAPTFRTKAMDNARQRCLQCGEVLPESATQRRKFCSKLCRDRAARLRARQDQGRAAPVDQLAVLNAELREETDRLRKQLVREQRKVQRRDEKLRAEQKQRRAAERRGRKSAEESAAHAHREIADASEAQLAITEADSRVTQYQQRVQQLEDQNQQTANAVAQLRASYEQLSAEYEELARRTQQVATEDQAVLLVAEQWDLLCARLYDATAGNPSDPEDRTVLEHWVRTRNSLTERTRTQGAEPRSAPDRKKRTGPTRRRIKL